MGRRGTLGPRRGPARLDLRQAGVSPAQMLVVLLILGLVASVVLVAVGRVTP